MDTATLLRESPWHHLEDEPSVDTLARFMTIRQAPKGERILTQGCTDRWLGIVLDGEVEAVHQQIGGGERMLRVIGPGQTFGELSLLDARPRSASIDAVVDTTIAVLEVGALERMADEEPAVAYRLAMWLARAVSRRFRAKEDVASWSA